MKKISYGADQLTFDFSMEIEDEIMIEEQQEEFLQGDYNNVVIMLPQLKPGQQEDVARIEKRYLVGKGYMCTNGTGTGKTFVGLGTVYRFYVSHRKEILIVVPTDEKCKDWAEEAHRHFKLDVYQLMGINDCGFDIRVTTYANFYQNEALQLVDWDLIVYDESHYLMQNAKGTHTTYYEKHKKIANIPSAAKIKAYEIIGEGPQVTDDIYGSVEKRKDFKEKHEKWKSDMRACIVSLVEKTKILFLSATPFAYHKSIQYVDGCLLNITEHIDDKEEEPVHWSMAYNTPRGFDKFLCETFGYRMRNNKLTIPETGVDQSLMERNFFENMVKLGVMSTRQLELEKDYSRDFVTLESDLGDFINSGIELWWKPEVQEKYPNLNLVIGKKYTYLYVNQLLESVKAREIHVRIQQHLDLGRKVVVFHGYNNNIVKHPFQFTVGEFITQETENMEDILRDEISKWKREYPQYWNMDLNQLINTREAIKMHFPNAKEFNGEVPKKTRSKNKNDFNNDLSGIDVILIQQAAGKEGISLHDKSGVYQRALINLGLPIEPTGAIQIEGRIYREGLMSNAMFEYMTLQTNFEKRAFAEKIATRSRTAENLAMGNLARDLETSFKEGYLNSNSEPPSIWQGKGGKNKDRTLNVISEFEKAITYYYSRTKRTAANKSKEGVDYFATPEPLGYKMVEWLKPQPNEQGLEPSAGHGAIARFFPAFCRNHFIEPSPNLAAQLSINVHGKIEDCTFEDHHIINKYEFIAMNPPFGQSGKTAMEHVRKACLNHRNQHTRILAIVPVGPAMDKRLDEFFSSKEAQFVHWQKTLRLPPCTFNRAGTTVATKIIKITNWYGPKPPTRETVDLSYIQDIKEFFEAIEHLDF